jgi:hypothetical protein
MLKRQKKVFLKVENDRVIWTLSMWLLSRQKRRVKCFGFAVLIFF